MRDVSVLRDHRPVARRYASTVAILGCSAIFASITRSTPMYESAVRVRATSDAAAAPVLPIGTTLSVRLLDSLSGTANARGSTVRALVIAPVMRDARVALAAGDTVVAEVRDAGIEAGEGRRHFVLLAFTTLRTTAGDSIAIQAQVADLPNARETVDSTGRIVGPERPGSLRSRADWAATLLATTNPVAGTVFFAAFRGEAIERHRRIAYQIGTEMTVRLSRALTLANWPQVRVVPPARRDEQELCATTPLRATTAGSHLPADVVTLAIIATEGELLAGFRRAGWTAPERSSWRSDVETLTKAAHAAGFAGQPVSTLFLGEQAQVFAFEKVVNSMARRDHIRIWPWGAAIGARRLWLVTASRDDGVLFSDERRSFGHRVDPAIDIEREKVVNDLLTEGVVARLSMLPRSAPTAPLLVNNGEAAIISDWRLALLVLTPAVTP